jgi:hypothetical protein
MQIGTVKNLVVAVQPNNTMKSHDDLFLLSTSVYAKFGRGVPYYAYHQQIRFITKIGPKQRPWFGRRQEKSLIQVKQTFDDIAIEWIKLQRCRNNSKLIGITNKPGYQMDGLDGHTYDDVRVMPVKTVLLPEYLLFDSTMGHKKTVLRMIKDASQQHALIYGEPLFDLLEMGEQVMHRLQHDIESQPVFAVVLKEWIKQVIEKLNFIIDQVKVDCNEFAHGNINFHKTHNANVETELHDLLRMGGGL